ncbi:Rqc2 family fibronectin-binding protein [Garciella nitratireducens]|uniref:Rqc2 family fibronectin-binding protein n=1 Tax=Garciella nitratireducens TaxID=218205 RepID=UPI000DEBDBEB|nr:NFACT RNA binding domain-containing protein [Garciella nitratireducens]RBP39185.1 putative ribosome quality control (RQC) complex YloA/Tae2 family protein [Garciella nitratireducens]
MAFDGIIIKSLINELNQTLYNGRIEKIYQPETDEIYINIRNNRNNYTLLLSANANNPRIYLTKLQKSNPTIPPNFCMLLRKHLTKGKILSIRQPLMERIIEIDISTMNELGDIEIKTLIIEIMGRHSNIILIYKNNQKIIDSIKRVGSNMSRYRQVLPGKKYFYPPSQNKHNPLSINKEDAKKLLEQFPSIKKIEKFFIESFTGISPLIAREICFISGIDGDDSIEALTEKQKKYLLNSFFDIMQLIKAHHFSPIIIYNKTQTNIIAFSVIPLRQYDHLPQKSFLTTSNLLEKFYYEKDKLERIKQKSSDLLHHLNNKLERSYKKLEVQQNEYKKSQKASIYKLYGELITANIYSLKKGLDTAILSNFYSQKQEKIKIPLNPNLTPAQNAQKYFKKYNKSKNAIKQLNTQIQNTKEDIYYLESQIENLKNCTELEEIQEIKEELKKEGYLAKSNKKSSKDSFPSTPLHFISSNGFDIYVGKNNRQNDFLTLKFASENDLWFHTKNIPGSHVIIKNNTGKEIPEKTLLEAASLAAYYSKSRNSNKVPVDYTKVKYVKKIKGAKPGMVIYENNQTIYITPEKEKIFLLKKGN